MDTNSVLIFVTLAVQLILEVSGHGRLVEPPSRSSMWRYGFDTPINYNDNQLFCGGRFVSAIFFYNNNILAIINHFPISKLLFSVYAFIFIKYRFRKPKLFQYSKSTINCSIQHYSYN